MAIVAVLGLVIAGVWLSLRDGTPIEVAESPAPVPEATPEPTPEPTEDPDPEDPPIVALTTAGELVEIDPDTGATLRLIASDPSWRGSLSVDPDRAFAYVFSLAEGQWPGSIDRVSLADGSAAEFIADARGPAVSPDGQTLAHVAVLPVSSPRQEGMSNNLVLLDLETGESEAFMDLECVECGRSIGSPAWAPDASTVYLPLGWADGVPWSQVVAVQPGGPGSLADAGAVGPRDADADRQAWFGVAFLSDTRMAVMITDNGTEPFDPEMDPSDFPRYVAIVEPLTGAVLERIDTPGVTPDQIVGRPTLPGLAVIDVEYSTDGSSTSDLYIWDPDGGIRLLRQGIAAVAW